jgi:hypothetical protein
MRSQYFQPFELLSDRIDRLLDAINQVSFLWSL